ncbi:hypothetical protein G6F57_022123 [Rhizopus arrhizus]|nr:hypothetical protein G6F57_022123 [Rhizopus arrhizus]
MRSSTASAATDIWRRQGPGVGLADALMVKFKSPALGTHAGRIRCKPNHADGTEHLGYDSATSNSRLFPT